MDFEETGWEGVDWFDPAQVTGHGQGGDVSSTEIYFGLC